jgi:gas vesicle protein
MNHDTHDDTARGNGSRRPTQIMAEINRTRDEMDQTLNAIEQRLTPGQLVDQGLDFLKHSGAREYAANLGHSVKTNPLPVTLAGIGLAWMMATSNRPQQPASSMDSGPGIGERMQSAKDSVGGKMQSTRDSLSSGVQSTKQSLTSGVQSARDSLTSGMQSARERASQIGETAGRQVDRARENWDYILRENPLVLGAVGLAIGALAAALAPRTRTEDQLMGETRDKLVDQAKQAGSAKLEEAKQAATSAKDTAVEAVKSKADAIAKPDARSEAKPPAQAMPSAQSKPPAQSKPAQKPGGNDGEWPYASPGSLEKAEDPTKQQQRPPPAVKR